MAAVILLPQIEYELDSSCIDCAGGIFYGQRENLFWNRADFFWRRDIDFYVAVQRNLSFPVGRWLYRCGNIAAALMVYWGDKVNILL